MAFPITPIRTPGVLPPLKPLDKTQAGGFQGVLSEAIGHIEQFQQNAQTSIDKFLSGEDQEVHKVALATQETQMAFDLFLQVRNKVISAYQEVMRMQM
jgi:flagellar hook-basal body complex protein FliE